MTSFALAAPVGLLLSKSDSVRTAVAWLSTPLSLPAVVTLATGLALHRRVVSRRLSTLKTAGTSLAVFGSCLMFAAVAFAWPDAVLLMVVGLFSFAALSVLAAVGKMPALHVPAIACCAIAVLVGFHFWQGAFEGFHGDATRHMLRLFWMGRSSAALTGFAIMVGGISVLLKHQRREAESFSYLVGCGGVACLSIVLALLAGFFGPPSQDPNLATPVLLCYAISFAIGSYLVPQAGLSWLGSIVLLAGFAHALGWNTAVQDWLASASLSPRRPVLVATLLHGLVVVVAAALLGVREFAQRDRTLSKRWRQLVVPLLSSALLSSALAFPFAILVRDEQFGAHAWYLVALSLIWLIATFIQGSAFSFSIFQALATVSVNFTAASNCQQQSWWDGNLLLPQHVQFQFTALAMWCLAWSAGRRLARGRWSGIVSVMRGADWSVDEVVLAAAVVGMFVMCLIGCWPGVAIELHIAEPSSFSDVLTSQAMFGLGAWLAAILLFAAVAGSLCERFSVPGIAGLLVASSCAPLLIAGQFSEQWAVASALRWTFAIYGTVLTALICLGGRIDAAIRRARWLP